MRGMYLVKVKYVGERLKTSEPVDWHVATKRAAAIVKANDTHREDQHHELERVTIERVREGE